MMRTDRTLAATALAYPVLTVIAFAAFPEPPGGDVSPAHDPAWLAAHTGAVIAQSYVRAVGALGFLALAVALSRRGRGAPARLTLLGGGATGALLLVAQAPVLAAALGARQGVAHGVLRVADPLNAALLDLSSVPAVLLFGGAALALLALPDGPRWLAWLSAVGVPLGLLDAASYHGGPLEAVGLAGLAYFLLWSLLVGAWLLRTPAPTQATTVPGAGMPVRVGYGSTSPST